MPWTKDNPPAVAKNWTPEQQARCVSAANAALENDATDQQAILACISAAGVKHSVEQEPDGSVRISFDGAGSVTAEIFAAGRWNGTSYSEADLHEIAATFEKLKSVHKVPLKLGHNDMQPLTDGAPALGWVEQVWVAPGADGTPKLFAKFTDVPPVVMQAIKARKYRKVSIELDLGVKYKGDRYPFVLSGVALLGADLPAVNTLADLTHYLDRSNARLSREDRAEFSAISGELDSNHEDDDMGMEEQLSKLTERFERLEKETGDIKEENHKLKEENAKLAQEKAEFQRKEEERAKAEKEASVKHAREQVTSILEDGVKAGKILPAQREKALKLFRVDDDDAVVNIDVKELKEFVGISKQEKPGTSPTGAAGDGTDSDAGKDPGTVVHDRTTELMGKDPKITYSDAMKRVLSADPELASRYATGETEEA